MALAELAGSPRRIGDGSNCSRSIVKPSEQDWTHTGGGAGCLAAFGSGGISRSITKGGGKVGGVALQLARASAQTISGSFSSHAGKVFGIDGLLLDMGCFSLGGGLALQGFTSAALLGFSVVGERGRDASCIGLRVTGAEPLRSSEQKRQRQHGAEHWRYEAIEHDQNPVTKPRACA